MSKLYNKILTLYNKRLIFNDSRTIAVCVTNRHLFADANLFLVLYCAFCNRDYNNHRVEKNYNNLLLINSINVVNRGFDACNKLHLKVIRCFLRIFKYLKYFKINIIINRVFKYKRISRCNNSPLNIMVYPKTIIFIL